MGVGCAGLGLRGVLLSAACLGLFAAAPTEKPLKFGEIYIPRVNSHTNLCSRKEMSPPESTQCHARTSPFHTFLECESLKKTFVETNPPPPTHTHTFPFFECWIDLAAGVGCHVRLSQVRSRVWNSCTAS